MTQVEPVGAARHRREAARGGRPRALGAEPDPELLARDAAGLPRPRGRPGGPRVRQLRVDRRRDGARSRSRPRPRTRCGRCDYVIAAEQARWTTPLLAVRREICRRVRRLAGGRRARSRARPRAGGDPADYPAAVADWHEARVAAYEQVLAERPGDGGVPGLGRPGALRLDDPDRRGDRGARRVELDVRRRARASARSSCSPPGTGSCCTTSASRCTSPPAGGCARRSSRARTTSR